MAIFNGHVEHNIPHSRYYQNPGSTWLNHVSIQSNRRSIWGGGFCMPSMNWGMPSFGLGGFMYNIGHPCHEALKVENNFLKFNFWTGIAGIFGGVLTSIFGRNNTQQVATTQYQQQGLSYGNQYAAYNGQSTLSSPFAYNSQYSFQGTPVDQNAQLAEKQKEAKQAKEIANIKTLYASEKGLSIIPNDNGTYTARYNDTNYEGTYDEIKEQLDKAIKAKKEADVLAAKENPKDDKKA